MPSALLVDDDTTFRLAMSDFLEDRDFSVTNAEDFLAAKTALEAGTPDLLIVDLVLPDGSGLDLVDALPASAATRVLVVTGHPSVETAVSAVRKRIDEYLVKPVGLEDLEEALAKLSFDAGTGSGTEGEAAPVRRPAVSPSAERESPLRGDSTAMRKLLEAIERVAPTEATVLVQGESGTGKELIAREIHALSGRSGTLVAVNCGAIAENLIASELFGHEKGSFTGAERQHAGIFERASGGTVFLDEITEMPADLQVNLLRVLETGTVRRVGGTKEIPVEARVVAATNRNPEEAVAEGRLREDLYYRLAVYPLRVPSLRERPDDIILLAEHFLAQQNATYGTTKALTEGARERLLSHTWPGNVRELKHTIQRMYINADEDIDESAVPEDFDRPPMWDRNSLKLTVGTPIAEAERRLLLATLEHFDGDKKLAAQTLGISLKTLYNRLNAYAEEDGAEPGEAN